MIMLFLILISLNIIIFFNIEKFEKFFNVYDLPDKKLKLHKKKLNFRWYNFIN